jgi:hypothetical protein
MAQQCEADFDISAWAAGQGKEISEAREVFKAIVQAPLLAEASRNDNSGDGQSLVQEHRKRTQWMAELSRRETEQKRVEFARLKAQVERDLREENEQRLVNELERMRADVRQKTEKDIWEQMQKDYGIPEPRRRKRPRAKTVDDAVKAILEANTELAKATKAEARKLKREVEKKASSGEHHVEEKRHPPASERRRLGAMNK